MGFLSGLTSFLGQNGGNIASGLLGQLQALGGIASTLLTNKSNRQIAGASNEMQQLLWQQEADWTERMYNEANEFNAPAALRKRYEDAGINPNLAMSGQPAGQAAALTAPKHGQPAVSYNQNPFTAGTGAEMVNAAIGMARAQAEIANINEDTRIKGFDVSTYFDRFKTKQALDEATARKLNAEGTKVSQDWMMSQSVFADKVKEQREVARLQKFAADLQESQFKLAELNLKYVDQEKKAQLQLLLAGAKEKIANASASYSIVKLNRALEEKNYAEVVKIANECAGQVWQNAEQYFKTLRQAMGVEFDKLSFQRQLSLLPAEIQQAVDMAYKIHKESRVGYIYARDFLQAFGLGLGLVGTGQISKLGKVFSGSRKSVKTSGPAAGAPSQGMINEYGFPVGI